MSGHCRTGEGLSPKSVWNVHLCLSRAIKDAIKDKLLAENPARGTIKPPREKPVATLRADASLTAIPLPRQGSGNVRSAMLHVIALARFALVYTRGWAAESRSARMRQLQR